MPPLGAERGDDRHPSDSTWSQPGPVSDRVAVALEEYVSLLEEGKLPGQSDFLQRHGSIAEPLKACLDGLGWVQRVAPEFGPEGVANGIPPGAAGATLGEFRLIREIGRGGMGVVYEAEQMTLGRRVALKVLPTAASLDPRQRQRFQVEAQAAALLHHEHIVPIHAIGLDHGAHFYAMQLIDGESLTELIRRQRADREAPRERTPSSPGAGPAAQRGSGHSSSARERARELARLALQAAEALDHAHDLGVIHRDVKPSNLLVDQRGKLWVADFGLARLPQDEHELTRTGDLVGTLRYMSPEQVRAERGGVTAATDLYSLGATLYELVTLRPPFEASDRQELLRRILHDEPTPPRRIDPAIPRDLETIILKAMEKEPTARYATARELADDLTRFLDDRPVRARRPGIAERAVRWARRHRTAVVAAMSALVVTLAATTVILWHAKRQTEATLDENRKALIIQRQGVEYALGALDQITRPLAPEPGRAVPPGGEAARVLPWAISYYDRIPGLVGNGEMVNEAVARALRQAGFCRLALGQANGRKDYRSAVELYERLIREHPGQLWLRTGLIETLHEYARFLGAGEDEAEARRCLGRALEIAESLIGHPEASKACYAVSLAGAFRDLADTLGRRSSDPSWNARAAALQRQAEDWERVPAGVIIPARRG